MVNVKVIISFLVINNLTFSLESRLLVNIGLFKSVRYVIVRVSDVSKIVSFWRDNIGLEPSYVTGVWSEIPLENIIIALLHDEDASPKRTGIVFEVDDIHETVEKLKARGVRVGEVSDIGFGLLAFFNDPEGNEYEIFQPR